jgi:hypothetical protein
MKPIKILKESNLRGQHINPGINTSCMFYSCSNNLPALGETVTYLLYVMHAVTIEVLSRSKRCQAIGKRRERESNTVTVMVLGGGKRVSHLTSCAAKAVSFVSLAAIIFSLRLPDEPSGEDKPSGERKERGKCIGQLKLETRKFLPFGSLEIPAGDGNKGIQTAECIGKSNLELREFPPFGSKEIPPRNKNKGRQMAECVGKSNLELRKFLPVRSK